MACCATATKFCSFTGGMPAWFIKVVKYYMPLNKEKCCSLWLVTCILYSRDCSGHENHALYHAYLRWSLWHVKGYRSLLVYCLSEIWETCYMTHISTPMSNFLPISLLYRHPLCSFYRNLTYCYRLKSLVKLHADYRIIILCQ